MPRGDRTGPMGMGPMTGRAAGHCAGYGMAGAFHGAPGRGGGGWGWGFGGRGFRGGFGFRHWGGGPGFARFGGIPEGAPSPEIEKRVLRSQVDELQRELDATKARLSEIEGGKADE